MTDTTHNTLVTILLLIAAIIVFILLGRWFQTGTFTTRYAYQPASTIGVYQDARYVPNYYSQEGIVSFTRSRPSYTYMQPVSQTQYESTSYESSNTYSYSCDGMGHCWTNQ